MEYISTKEYVDLHGLKDKSGGLLASAFLFAFPLQQMQLGYKTQAHYCLIA